MTIIESSITINKPVEKVFGFLTDLDNQKKLSEYITGVESDGPLKMGSRYKVTTTSYGHTNVMENEVVAFESNKKFGVKTIAKPPASDVTSTYLLEKEGSGTKLTLQVDAVIMAPGMEEMIKTQMKTGFDTVLASTKKAIEG